jgi:type IV pilus assembly protein PilA
MLSKLRSRAEGEQGFTLVELLVVILIIGILAGIAIPAFLGQRQKAYDSQAKSNLRTAQTAEETYATDHDGTYVAAVTGAAAATTDPLVAIEPTLKNDPGVTATLVTGGYSLTASSAGANSVVYVLGVANGTVTRTCTPHGTGGCKSAADANGNFW